MCTRAYGTLEQTHFSLYNYGLKNVIANAKKSIPQTCSMYYGNCKVNPPCTHQELLRIIKLHFYDNLLSKCELLPIKKRDRHYFKKEFKINTKLANEESSLTPHAFSLIHIVKISTVFS